MVVFSGTREKGDQPAQAGRDLGGLGRGATGTDWQWPDFQDFSQISTGLGAALGDGMIDREGEVADCDGRREGGQI